MNLSHVAHVWDDSQAEFFRQQAYREKLGDPRNTRAIHLYDLHRACLHKVLEHDSVWNMLAQCNRDRFDGFCECAVGTNVVWMGWFLHEEGGHLPKFVAHLERSWKSPLLVGIDHDQRVLAGQFAQHESASHVTLAVARSHLQLESMKASFYGLLRQLLSLLLVILKPAHGRVVPGIATAQDACTLCSGARVIAKDAFRLFPRKNLFEITQVKQIDYFLCIEVQQQSPERHAAAFCPQVKTRVGKRGECQVHHTLMRAEPAKLRMLRQLLSNRSEVGHQIFDFPADQFAAKPFDHFANQLVPKAESEHNARAKDLVGSEESGRKCILGA